MVTFQPALFALGEIIGLPENIMEKVDDVLMNNRSIESLTRAGVSFGNLGVFKLLDGLGIRVTQIVSNGVNNTTSELLIEIMTGEVGEVYDKAMQDKIKTK